MDMASELTTTSMPVIACDLSARDLAIRAETLRQELFAAAAEVRQLADGYAFRFAGTDELQAKLFEFVTTERVCCSFFHIELIFEPQHGPIWLHLRGAEGVKAFVEHQFAATV
jgi:hypothetical protein